MASDSLSPDFHLSKSFYVSDSPIRALAISGPNIHIGQQQPPFLTTINLETGERENVGSNNISGQVTSLLTLNDTTYLVGSLDTHIRIISNNSQSKQISGHQGGIISLSKSLTSPSEFFSGSWDGTCRHWNVNGDCLDVIEGHENGVQCVHHGCGALVTGSSGENEGGRVVNMKMRVWRQGDDGKWSIVQSISPHTQSIRSLHLPSSSTLTPIISCGNDGQVCFTDVMEGGKVVKGVVKRLQYEKGYLLDVGSVEGGMGGYDVVVGNVDGECVFWGVEEEKVKQVVQFPGTVWKVLGCEGEVITGCNDGIVRVFSRDLKKIASEDKAIEYLRKIRGGPSAEEVSKYDLWDTREPCTQGDKTVKVFNKGGSAWAAQWDAISEAWVLIGEVTGTDENRGKIDGVEFDHVLPIEHEVAGGGVRTLKIGYNNGENPFVVAQKFIDEHQMDQNDLTQIADYITKRTGAKTETPTIDMTQEGSMNGDTTMEDMFGAGGSNPPGSLGAAVQSPPAVTFETIPIRSVTVYGAGEDKVEKAVDKVKEGKVSEADASTLDDLARVIKDSSRYHASTISDSSYALLLSLLNSATDATTTFPVIDLFRLAILHPSASKQSPSFWCDVVDKIVVLMEAVPASNVAVPMLGLRVWCNLSKIRSFYATPLFSDKARIERICALAKVCVGSVNKNVRASAVILVMDLAYIVHITNGLTGASIGAALLDVVLVCLQDADVENRRKGLLAVGTLVIAGGKDLREEVVAEVRKGRAGCEVEEKEVLKATGR
ncbi:hypothetical protein TL16_g09350 [Triparma laevis f. inornata]|uniref:Phospholipase A-2-activating protein n=1 Tax=Triparma laevis f. inornata TaxID=1714386 RepID=A0A9W7B9F3_9STRA|nr:hypothetical protein TL16_g09350 [Triparma laevis f. inornata]